MNRLIIIYLILFSLVGSSASSATDLSFIPVTPENTRLADGSELPKKIESIGWLWRPEKGDGGVFESVPDQDRKSAILMVKAAGLEAGKVYEVFGYFWASHEPSTPNQSIQLGLSLATMHPFDGVRTDDLMQKEPWVITPGYKTGEAFGLNAVVEREDPLASDEKIVPTQDGERLIRARLGFSRASKDGTLPVFFSPNNGSRSPGIARMNGIAIRPAAADASLDQGRKLGTMLHLAIRAGDSITIQREIEAGADVNAFDEDGVTPLFYAAACGDKARVRMLLELRANPNQPEQSVPPLTAAATIADPAIVKLLLDAGADVALTLPKNKGALATDVDPRILHPVVAAIRAGSVPVLKQLLIANKDLRIPKLEENLRNMETPSQPKLEPMNLVGESMLWMNWDMAAYLIDSGASITCRAYSTYTSPAGLMLADTVQAGPDALPVMEAMLRRGEPVVTNSENRSEDTLNTAAFHGNKELVRRFLPSAAHVWPGYQNALLEKALSSGDAEIIEMVRSKFPEAKAPRWQPKSETEGAAPLEETAKRWFLPRTSPPPQASTDQPKGKHTLAVIAAPDAVGVGDILTTYASQSDDWKVVEREQIEAALGENRFSKPWLNGEHRLSELGDRLIADCLIVVSSLRIRKEFIYRFEIVEVATGLEIHREHVKSDAFVDKKEVASFLERAASALDAAGRNERHQAITLLTFSAQGGVENSSAVSGLLRATVQHEVDSTPGLISLSRAQSSRLIEEQALDGKNSLWGAAHMIEGVVSAEKDGDIKVTLRLETFKDGISTKTDATAIGKATDIAEAAVAAWKNLMAASGNKIAVTADHPDAAGISLNEGRRLMREADWLQSINADPASYRPLIESALALGVPAEETILLHLDSHFRNFMFLFPGNSDAQPDRNHKHATALQHFPDILYRYSPSLAFSDQLAYKLPAVRELLHLTSWYLEHRGREGLEGGTDHMQVYSSYKHNEVWYAIQALSAIRALIYPGQFPENLNPEFDLFTAELDALTKRYFSLLQTVPSPDFSRYYLQSTDFRLIQRNPAIAEGLAGMATKGVSLTALLHVYAFDYREDFGTTGFQWMKPRKDLARKMIHNIGDDPSLRMRFAKADLEYFIADSTQRPIAIRQLIDIYAETRWQTAPTRDDGKLSLLSQSIVNSYTTSHLFRRNNISSLQHNGSMLPSSLFAAKPAPDLLIRFNTYQEIFNTITIREAWKQNEKPNNIDTFRESILAYDSYELMRLKAETSSKKPVNASHHSAPGFSVTPESRNIISMICGAGKSSNKSDKKEKPKKPEPSALQATMLTDLRTGKLPGTIIWPLVDNVDSNLLWVFYFPSVGNGIRVSQPGGGGALNYGHVCDAPWLLGINCRDGSIVHKVNLHAAVGEAYGMDLSNRHCEVWHMGLDQTKDRILTSVGWYDKKYSGNKMGSVIIDKKTGKAHPIPGNPAIEACKGDISLDLWDRNNGVAAVGEHFFYLNAAGDWTGGAIKGVRSGELAIFQVFPDLSVKPLTIMGRRPELTPFDAPNRAPISITPHGERLMVIHPSTIAEYDPVNSDWSITAALPSEKPTNKHTNTVADAQYWDFLQSINDIKVGGESTGWIVMGWWHPPGVLPFASRTKDGRMLRITAPIPDDFLNTTYAIEEPTFDKDGIHEGQKILIKDHPKFKKSDVVVLAQTEKDLILGMQTNDNYAWNHPSRNSHHLPFLWKISKQEILSKLDDE